MIPGRTVSLWPFGSTIRRRVDVAVLDVLPRKRMVWNNYDKIRQAMIIMMSLNKTWEQSQWHLTNWFLNRLWGFKSWQGGKCLIMIFFEIPVMSLNALTHMHSPMNFHGRPAPVQLASESWQRAQGRLLPSFGDIVTKIYTIGMQYAISRTERNPEFYDINNVSTDLRSMKLVQRIGVVWLSGVSLGGPD